MAEVQERIDELEVLVSAGERTAALELAASICRRQLGEFAVWGAQLEELNVRAEELDAHLEDIKYGRHRVDTGLASRTAGSQPKA